MVDDIDPPPLGIIFAPAFPILGMHEVNATVLVGFSRGFAPVQVLIPLHERAFQTIEFAHQ
jgi:hypothetical protein